MSRPARLIGIAPLVFATACSPVRIEPTNYATYREHVPRSILVLPPRNDSTRVDAPYIWLSTITMPLVTRGYYTYPVAVVDAFMKENGLGEPEAMHSVPLQKLHDVFGADAVLYVTIEDWGWKFGFIVGPYIVVRASARLVDARGGEELWRGVAYRWVSEKSGSDDPWGEDALASYSWSMDGVYDVGREVARAANSKMVADPRAGLLPGPRNIEAR